MKKNTITIASIILFLVGGIIGGMFLSGKKTNEKEVEKETSKIDTVITTNASGRVGNVNPTKGNTQKIVSNEVASSERKYSAMPEIKSVSTPVRKVSDASKPGYNFTVSATSSDNAKLEYVLCEKGSNEVRYKSNNGSFTNVVPNDGGIYELTVRNTNTGETTSREVRGFKKVKKISQVELETILNDSFYGEQHKDIYFHFDVDRLVIESTGLSADIVAPKSLGAIWEGLFFQGWTIKVIGTPKYDEYNRITSFKIYIQ